MAQQVKIAGTTYNDVPYIQCPDENDVLHKFLDTTINANAATAEDLVDGKYAYVNGDLLMGNAVFEWYATSSTGASTAAKTATCSDFALVKGATVNVRFSNGNTAASPTLNVNSTGAKSIYANNSTTAANCTWSAGETVHFVYDGTYWRMVNSVGLNSVKESKVDKTSMNVQFAIPSNSTQLFQIMFTVKNENNSSFNGHSLTLTLANNTIFLWDNSTSTMVWSK